MIEALLGSVAFYGAVIVGAATVLDPQYVFIDDFTVASEVKSRGYTESETVARLSHAITVLDQKAQRIQPSKQVNVLDATSPIQIIGTKFHITPYLRAIQHAAGFADKSVTGAITIVEPGKIEITVRISRDDGERLSVVKQGPIQDIDALFQETAHEAYRYISPYSFALLEFEKGLPTHNFEKLYDQIGVMIDTDPHPYERAWLRNLRGLIKAVEGDRTAAMQSFERAIAESPSEYPVGFLNRGYLKYLANDNLGAIADYRKGLEEMGLPMEARGILQSIVAKGTGGLNELYVMIFHYRDRAPRPNHVKENIMAGLFAAWAEAEWAEKRPDCAEALFRMAIKADPSSIFANDAYVEFLEKAGRHAEAVDVLRGKLGASKVSHEELPSILGITEIRKRVVKAMR